MWLFTKQSFLSIVHHRDQPDMLVVRARVKGDIERYFAGASVIRTNDADYLLAKQVNQMRYNVKQDKLTFCFNTPPCPMILRVLRCIPSKFYLSWEPFPWFIFAKASGL